jgi:hypothetical protein
MNKGFFSPAKIRTNLQCCNTLRAKSEEIRENGSGEVALLSSQSGDRTKRCDSERIPKDDRRVTEDIGHKIATQDYNCRERGDLKTRFGSNST